MYKDMTTGEIWTEEELRKEFEDFRDEMRPQFDSFEEYVDDRIRGRWLEEI